MGWYDQEYVQVLTVARFYLILDTGTGGEMVLMLAATVPPSASPPNWLANTCIAVFLVMLAIGAITTIVDAIRRWRKTTITINIGDKSIEVPSDATPEQIGKVVESLIRESLKK
jgi:hypothetical protein